MIMLLFSLNSYCQTPLVKFNEENRAKNPQEILRVSILQLITTPEKYDGKLIEVTGFIKLEFEGTAIYLHQEDYKNHIYKNSIWLTMSKETLYSLQKECSEKYGSVCGTFKAEPKGHFGLFSGTITNINGIYPDDYFGKD
jgi:hypothetical protein